MRSQITIVYVYHDRMMYVFSSVQAQVFVQADFHICFEWLDRAVIFNAHCKLWSHASPNSTLEACADLLRKYCNLVKISFIFFAPDGTYYTWRTGDAHFILTH